MLLFESSLSSTFWNVLSYSVVQTYSVSDFEKCTTLFRYFSLLSYLELRSTVCMLTHWFTYYFFQVLLMARFVHRHLSLLDPPGLELLLPYALSLMSHPWTAVQAVWAMFNPLATALGPTRSAAVFLPPISSLMDGEWSSQKHVKLYHRSFIIQLLIRLGVKCFLANFATLLVEAAAGYKDFNDEEVQVMGDAENGMASEAEQPDLDYPEVFEMDEREMSGELLDIPAIAEQQVYQVNIKSFSVMIFHLNSNLMEIFRCCHPKSKMWLLVNFESLDLKQQSIHVHLD